MVDAKKFEVPDFYPRGFLIEIVDGEQNPIKEVEFSFIVDGIYSKKGTTDDRGILNVQPVPQNEVRLSLGEQLESPPKLEEETTEEITGTAVSEIHSQNLDTLAIRLIDVFGRPVENAKYLLEVENQQFEGVTSDKGILSHSIPREAKTGKLILGANVFDLWIEDIGSSDTVRGAEVRLKNLGYFSGEQEELKSEENEKEMLRLALMGFQNEYHLDAGGEIDMPTAKKLAEIYGN